METEDENDLTSPSAPLRIPDSERTLMAGASLELARLAPKAAPKAALAPPVAPARTAPKPTNPIPAKATATFIPANFWLGIIIVWGYRWLSARYGPGPRTALRTGLVAWVIFWVIPMLAMQPLRIFPHGLLALTILVGLADGLLATMLGAWLAEGMKWPAAVIATTGSFRHSGRSKGIT